MLLYRVQVRKDPEAFAELYDKYIEQIYQFVFFKLSNTHEAEDVTSEVFLKTWDYLTNPASKRVNRFSSFIYQVARNKVIDVYRQRSTRQTYSLDEVPEESVVAEQTTEFTVSAGQDKDRMLAALARMKQEYQEVILLRHIDGLPMKDIAIIVGKGQAAVRVTLHRAMKKLQEMLQEPGK